jgi:microcin C transport system permease protein
LGYGYLVGPLSMLQYVLKRIALMVPTLLGILLLTFVVIQFVPGGPVEQYLAEAKAGAGGGAEGGGLGYRGAQGVDLKRIEQIKALYGFDKPAHERFWQMLTQFARFDLGKSFYQNRDVADLIWEKLPVSMSLGLWTFFISYLVAVPLGVAKAVRAGSRFDLLTSLLILVGYAIPGFVLGVALLVVFGGQLQWFPLRGLTSSDWDQMTWGARVVDYLWHITLPVTAMVVGSFATTAMLTKNSFLEEIRKQYVVTARAKGLSERRVLWKHVMRNALIPIVTGFPAAFIGAFFTGALLIETQFSLDGLGLLSYESVIRRDYPVVMGTLFLFTLIGLVTKLVSDLCYVWVDPRVKFD